MLHKSWKALHAVPDNNLAEKLCNALMTTLGEASLSSDSERIVLPYFSPALGVMKASGEMSDAWTRNPSEAHVSVILVSHEFKFEPLRQSSSLLYLGVFNAAAQCMGLYDRLRFKVQAQQKVLGATSIVDFHILVNDVFVAVVEAKSPSVMHQLRLLLPQRHFKVRWTPGSKQLVSRIFSKVGI